MVPGSPDDPWKLLSIFLQVELVPVGEDETLEY